MKNYLIVFFILLLSCNSNENKKHFDDNTTNIVSVKTNEEKYALIEAIFFEHGGFDVLNFIHHQDNNYIQILATNNSNETPEFEYIKELFWWNNSSYFNDFLLQKINNKLKDTKAYSQETRKKRAEPMVVEVKSVKNDLSKC